MEEDILLNNHLDEIEQGHSIKSNASVENIVSKYFSVIQKKELLSAQEEKEIAKQIYSSNKELASKSREDLILHNLRLAINLAQKYSKSYEQFIELVQEAITGLIKACDRFDPELGFRFSTYATWWVKQSIFKYFNNKEKIIRIPTNVLKLIHRKKQAIEFLQIKLGKHPNQEELLDYLEDVTEKELKKLSSIEETFDQVQSLDIPLSGEDNSDMSLLDVVANENEKSVEDIVDINIFSQQINKIFQDVLTDREINIVKNRFGLNHKKEIYSLQKLAEELSISIERVRQIEKKSLQKLRDHINS